MEQGRPQIYSLKLKLPRGLTCSQCVLQWKYNAGMFSFHFVTIKDIFLKHKETFFLISHVLNADFYTLRQQLWSCF